ncbi:MAG: polysaccharide biosynthesis/export family protein [Halioglobus sp.]|nr:polysaccharide biosynthesis/export family protein [Halioglobus sp.]
MTIRRLIVLTLLSFAVTACTTVQKDMPAQSLDQLIVQDVKPANAEDLDPTFRYRLSYGDEIDVRFMRQPDYSTTVVVSFDGTIKLPFLPSVRVEGMTIDEATKELQRRYAALIEDAPAPDQKVYLLGPADIIEIKFPYVSQYSTTVKVGPDGRISMPLLGAVIAEDKTAGMLQRELESAYSTLLDNPMLSLNVVEAASSTVYSNGERLRVTLPEMDNLYLTLRSGLEPKVFVGGEVNAPQALQFQPMMTSLQAIMSAGGINRRAEMTGVVILRKGINGEPRYIVRNLLADIDGKETSQGSGEVITNDILLRPFDVIIVPRTAIAAVSDTLNAYLYDLLPMLKNSSIGFNYQIGSMKVNQDTKVLEPGIQ